MRSLLTSVAIATALFLSACSLQEPAPRPEKKSLKTFLTQKSQAEKIGLIEKLEITNIELERTTTGAKQKFASFSNTYNPSLELFELSFIETPDLDTYTFGIKQDGKIIDLELKYLESYDDEWMEINNVKYTIEYDFLENGTPAGQTSTMDKVTMTLKPTQPIPGTSNDYSNLINALNLGGGPKFNLANLRVINLDNIVLTVYF